MERFTWILLFVIFTSFSRERLIVYSTPEKARAAVRLAFTKAEWGELLLIEAFVAAYSAVTDKASAVEAVELGGRYVWKSGRGS